MQRLDFTLEATAPGSRARAARFRTRHNEVLTPTFMPVGTHAAVRAQRREDLLESGVQVMLANTYHLLLRPGVEIFEKFGGIHGFMNWPRSVLTDSGGFQIFSQPGRRTLCEDYAEFRSYTDQSLVRLSPERSIATQKSIGADIMMVLDQCVPSTVEHSVARAAMELTHRWAQRSLDARGDSPQALFGIVQGARFMDLRVESARAITELPFDGYAIGGLAVGESTAEREDCTATVSELLPADKPRYLMGVGTTRDLLEAVHRGVDMFDCILPTALAKQGVAFTSIGRRDLRRAAYRGMEGPIDPACACHTCKTYSIAYLLHLHRVSEPQGWQLLGAHNIHFYLTADAYHAAATSSHGTWLEFYRTQRDILDARDSYGKPRTARHQGTTPRGEDERAVAMKSCCGTTLDGFAISVSGEIMHSVNEPAAEARSLYVEQSRLVERLFAGGRCDAPVEAPLIVWGRRLGRGRECDGRDRRGARALSRRSQTVVAGELRERSSTRSSLPWITYDGFKHLRHPGPRSLC